MKKVFYFSSLLAFCFTLCSAVASAAPVPVSSINILTNPGNDTVCSGTSATFTASAQDTTGGVTTTVSYFWQVSTDGGTTWTTANDTTIYTGDSTNTLVVSAGLSMNGYKYRCVASDSNGTNTTASATLTVIGIAPGTISGPSIVCKSSSITLSDTVTGGTWSASNGNASITTGGMLTGQAQGYDTVSYTDTNMCGAGVTTVVIRIDTTATAMAISGPTSTCIGNTITLMDANILGTGTWSASNGNATVNSTGDVTGVSYGTDVIHYAFSNACGSVATESYTVTIDSVLNPGVISGSSSLCAGSWTPLTESVPGGSWFSSNSMLAVVSSSGYVTGVSQGTVTISYYLSNSCGASIATHTIVIDRMASMITGNDSVGVGLTRALSDSVTGGTWTSDDTAIATVDSTTGVVTGITVGTTTITYTVNNFCGTSTSVITMNVGNHPYPGAITGDTVVCLGSTITLSNSLVPGGIWTSSNDTFATVDSFSGVVTGVALDSGVASAPVTITYTFTNGFGDSTVTQTITVLHTPIISISEYPSFYQIGQNYFIKGTPSGGTWTNSNHSVGEIVSIADSAAGGVSYATFCSYVMVTAGTDVLRYTVTNSCGTADSTITATIPLVNGVANVNNANFALNVYPNPNQGEFTVSVAGNTTEDVTVTITNIVGETIQEFTVPANKLVAVKLDQPSGIYLLSANTSNGKYTTRVSISK